MADNQATHVSHWLNHGQTRVNAQVLVKQDQSEDLDQLFSGVVNVDSADRWDQVDYSNFRGTRIIGNFVIKPGNNEDEESMRESFQSFIESVSNALFKAEHL